MTSLSVPRRQWWAILQIGADVRPPPAESPKGRANPARDYVIRSSFQMRGSINSPWARPCCSAALAAPDPLAHVISTRRDDHRSQDLQV